MNLTNLDPIVIGKLKFSSHYFTDNDIIKYCNKKYCGRFWCAIQLFFRGKGIISIQAIRTLLKNHPLKESILIKYPHLQSILKVYSVGVNQIIHPSTQRTSHPTEKDEVASSLQVEKQEEPHPIVGEEEEIDLEDEEKILLSNPTTNQTLEEEDALSLQVEEQEEVAPEEEIDLEEDNSILLTDSEKLNLNSELCKIPNFGERTVGCEWGISDPRSRTLCLNITQAKPPYRTCDAPPHANWIEFGNAPTFIAGQTPLKSGQAILINILMWYNCKNIINLVSESEQMSINSPAYTLIYYPNQKGAGERYNIDANNYIQCTCLDVTTVEKNYVTYKLHFDQFTENGLLRSNRLKLHHLTNWPVSGTPSHSQLYRFMRAVDKDLMQAKRSKSPCFIHCVNGFGSTGSFLVSYLSIKTGSNDLKMVLNKLRAMRPNLIKDQDEYHLCAETLRYHKILQQEALKNPSKKSIVSVIKTLKNEKK